MESRIIRPSLKMVRAGYLAVGLLVAGFYPAGLWANWFDELPWWAPALGLLLALWPLKRHIVSRFDRLVVTADRLRLESGVLRRSSRMIQLSKVQDVRVEQTLWQRLLDTGDLYVETAGEAGQLFLPNVDSPHEVSAFILSAASWARGEDARAGV